MNQGAFQFRGGQRPWPGYNAAIYPNDIEHLATQRTDILVTHEAPSCHKYGFEELDKLSRSMKIVRSFHGHHHDDFSDEYALKREEIGFDARAVNFLAIKNGLGELVFAGPKKMAAMKIQIASDLHLEFLQLKMPGELIIKPASDAEVLILAGDIANSAVALELFANWPVPVLYVTGNHEFYGHPIAPIRRKLHELAGMSNGRLHHLQEASVEINGVRFLGATLWTDYLLNPLLSQTAAMNHAESCLNDHRLIRTGRHVFTARDALAEHEKSRKWLANELAKPFSGKTVVVTHHAPHPLSTHPKYKGNLLTPAFISDLSEQLPGADLWVHGHVHDGVDYQVGRCRVVANPAGYILNRGQASTRDEFKFENGTFDAGMVVEI